MKMDFDKVLERADRFDEIIAILESQREEIALQKERLLGNTELDGVIASVSRTEKRIEELLITVRKMKEAATAVRELYISGERNVVSAIDSGVRTKSGFRAGAVIVDNSQVNWSIR